MLMIYIDYSRSTEEGDVMFIDLVQELRSDISFDQHLSFEKMR